MAKVVQLKKKLTKDEVGYEHPSKHGQEDCGDCVHFQVLAKNHCEIVDGIIKSEDWCRKFKRE